VIVRDREATAWRKENHAAMLEQLKPFMDRAYRRSKSEKTAESKYVAVAGLCGWQKKPPNAILAEVKEGKTDPIKLLDEFVTYLQGINSAPVTIKNYVSGAKKWLGFSGFKIRNEDFREQVELPRQYAITRDRIPTNQELRDIVMACHKRGQALVTLLSSSGMRIDEALNLKVGDFGFSSIPTNISLKAEITKARTGRTAFCSSEATGYLKEYLGERIAEKDAYVFQGRHQGVRSDGTKYKRGDLENEPMSYWNAVTIFKTALKKTGLDEKDENGRATLHIHCLRKFFITRMQVAVGKEVTEAIVGHAGYLDAAYRRLTDGELAEGYLKGEGSISIFKNPAQEQTVLLYRKMVELGTLDVEDGRVQATISRDLGIPLSHPNFVGLVYQKIGYDDYHLDFIEDKKEDSKPKKDPKIIAENELQVFLDDGWEIQTTLPSGKIVVAK